MALKDLQAIDFERMLAVASEVDNVPEGARAYYQDRYKKLERIVARIQRDLESGQTRTLDIKERELYNLLSGNPQRVTTQAQWAKKAKPLRGFHGHHKAPLRFNAKPFIYLPPSKHYEVTQRVNARGIFFGNDMDNVASGHIVQHLGDSRVEVGPGSVAESWHPGGTNPGKFDVSPDATVRQIVDELTDANIDYVADVDRTLVRGSGSIMDAIYDAIDNKGSALGLDIDSRTLTGPEIFRQFNKYRREILDDAANIAQYSYELRSGFSNKDLATAFKQIGQSKTGLALGAAGALHNQKFQEGIEEGDLAKAGTAALQEVVGGVFSEYAVKNGAIFLADNLPAAGRVLPGLATGAAALSNAATGVGIATLAPSSVDPVVQERKNQEWRSKQTPERLAEIDAYKTQMNPVQSGSGNYGPDVDQIPDPLLNGHIADRQDAIAKAHKAGPRWQWCMKDGSICVKPLDMGLTEAVTGRFGGADERDALNGPTSL